MSKFGFHHIMQNMVAFGITTNISSHVIQQVMDISVLYINISTGLLHLHTPNNGHLKQFKYKFNHNNIKLHRNQAFPTIINNNNSIEILYGITDNLIMKHLLRVFYHSTT